MAIPEIRVRLSQGYQTRMRSWCCTLQGVAVCHVVLAVRSGTKDPRVIENLLQDSSPRTIAVLVVLQGTGLT